ncbi:MAG: methionine--tRNA ligase [Blastocatellia bacterium]|nr:methionine--tRNA ligase [Blastocatellia bacterium]
MKRFYVTTPIYYVNSKPHLGHVYTTLIADTLFRLKSQRGFDTFFLTGTDEHGQNIERAAAKNERPVKEHVDAIVAEFKSIFEKFNFCYSHWVRTTDDYHEEGAQELFRKVRDAGYIYKSHYEGWYCVGCAEFKEEMEAGKAPYCELHNREAERVSEESYFFKLSAFQDRLLKLYEERPDFIQPEVRRNEVISFVKSGLKDLSVSRVSVKWGIPLPDDPSHTMYVWFDALSNYITAIGYGNNKRSGFDNYWPANLQLVGKDIIRFHTVYWPAFLLAAGVEPPQKVYAHGMWLSGGRKMSKSLGNVININILLKHFSTDQIRYFCLREMVFGQDGDFTYEALIERCNADLAKGLGNLVSRTLKMVEKYCDSNLPAKPKAFLLTMPETAWHKEAIEVREVVLANRARFELEFSSYNFSRALEAVWEIIARVDKYISDNAPWKLAKDPSAREHLETVLYTVLEAIRFIAVLLVPILPDSALSVWKQVGLFSTPEEINPESLVWGELAEGITLGELKTLFPTIDKELTMSEIQKEESVEVTETTESKPTENREFLPLRPEITIDDFAKIDLRVAKVLEAERIPKADKLLKLIVDLGEEKPRQILAGIAQYYTPEQMVGRKIVIVANLEPRKLRGLESQGMLLAASIGEQGQPVLASFLEEVPIGARLK